MINEIEKKNINSDESSNEHSNENISDNSGSKTPLP